MSNSQSSDPKYNIPDMTDEQVESLLADHEELLEALSKLEADEPSTKSACLQCGGSLPDTKIERHHGESTESCVSRGIATLINEGKDPDQAAAMAYSMCGEKGGPGSGRHPGGGKPKEPGEPDKTEVTVGPGKPARISEGGQVSKPPSVSNIKPRPLSDITNDLNTSRDRLEQASEDLRRDPNNAELRNSVGRAQASVRDRQREGRAAVEHYRRTREKPKK